MIEELALLRNSDYVDLKRERIMKEDDYLHDQFITIRCTDLQYISKTMRIIPMLIMMPEPRIGHS